MISTPRRSFLLCTAIAVSALFTTLRTRGALAQSATAQVRDAGRREAHSAGTQNPAQGGGGSSPGTQNPAQGGGGSSPGTQNPAQESGAAEDPHAGLGRAGRAFAPELMRLPAAIAEEAPSLPAGVLLVRVVDALGAPVRNVSVRLGAMREGERQSALEAQTRADGIAQFSGLDTGSNVSYRASVENGRARFGSSPFMLPTQWGFQVQLVRFEIDTAPRAIVISNLRTEISFRDDRIVVAHRIQLANFSNVSPDGRAARPYAFVTPDGGLRFRIPAGFTAFNAQDPMGDQRVTEEHGVAVLRGSLPPTGGSDAIELAFRYHLRVRDGSANVDLEVPLQVLRSTVVAEAPPGLELAVEGMPGSVRREHNGQNFLVSGRELMGPDDEPLRSLHVRITGIPQVVGAERTAIAFAAALLVFVAIALGVQRRVAARRDAKGPALRVSPIELKARREELLAEIHALREARDTGEIGPETFEHRRREITIDLAEVLLALDLRESHPAKSARAGAASRRA